MSFLTIPPDVCEMYHTLCHDLYIFRQDGFRFYDGKGERSADVLKGPCLFNVMIA